MNCSAYGYGLVKQPKHELISYIYVQTNIFYDILPSTCFRAIMTNKPFRYKNASCLRKSVTHISTTPFAILLQILYHSSTILPKHPPSETHKSYHYILGVIYAPQDRLYYIPNMIWLVFAEPRTPVAPVAAPGDRKQIPLSFLLGGCIVRGVCCPHLGHCYYYTRFVTFWSLSVFNAACFVFVF